MKVSDFSIVFALMVICFTAAMNVRSSLLYERVWLNSRYNVIMDNAAEDALRAAYENVGGDGNPIVNLNTASEYFAGEAAVMLSGDKKLGDYYYDRLPVMIYTDREGFFCYRGAEGWSSIHPYGEGEYTEHSAKINTLLEFIRDTYGIELAIPYNDGEDFENTVNDYSLLVIYRGYDGMYCFSAAEITQKKIKSPQANSSRPSGACKAKKG